MDSLRSSWLRSYSDVVHMLQEFEVSPRQYGRSVDCLLKECVLFDQEDLVSDMFLSVA